LLTGSHELEQRELALLSRLARLAGQREGANLRQFERISALSGLLAEGLGLGERLRNEIEHAAQLHDIGNIGVADEILMHPGALDEDQRQMMQQHTVLGHEALHGGEGLLAIGAEIALGHHEHWDGSGYPHGLSGERIPQSARIVAVADVLDALLSERPWRPAWPLERAIEFIKAGSGRQFDPDVVAVLCSREAEIAAMLQAFEPA
jgi:two-component system response regulator RpfG